MNPADFRIFTTFRYDPELSQVHNKDGLGHAGWNYDNSSPIYMLDYHRDRLLRAATYWKWEAAITALAGDAGLDGLQNYILQHAGDAEKPMRMRLVVDEQGSFEHVAAPTYNVALSNLFPVDLPPPGQSNEASKRPEFVVYVDRGKTPSSEFTHFKTTNRSMYEAARERFNIQLPDSKEVLTINEANNTIMEGSTTTPYFWRNGRWVTPPVAPRYSAGGDSGGNDGTTRRWALEQ